MRTGGVANRDWESVGMPCISSMFMVATISKLLLNRILRGRAGVSRILDACEARERRSGTTSAMFCFGSSRCDVGETNISIFSRGVFLSAW